MADPKQKLPVTMDLGRFKAYRLETSPQESTPRLVLLEERDTVVNEPISEQVTDQAGQFPKGSRSFAAVNDMSNGERHNLALEVRRRALKDSARRISELLKSEGLDGCYFAAANEINQSVLEALDAYTRSRIEKNVTANLSRLGQPKILRQFCSTA
jgi:hypothetical protein